MKVSTSCVDVSLPTLTLRAFTATCSGTPDASSAGDGLRGGQTIYSCRDHMG